MLVALWILIGVTAFATALAAQMRFILSVVLRRALAHKFGGEYRDGPYHDAIGRAARTAPETDHDRFLVETYPAQIAQLKLARRLSMIGPALLLPLALLLRTQIA